MLVSQPSFSAGFSTLSTQMSSIYKLHCITILYISLCILDISTPAQSKAGCKEEPKACGKVSEGKSSEDDIIDRFIHENPAEKVKAQDPVEKQEAKDIRCLYGTFRLNIYEDMLLKLSMSPLPRRKCQYIQTNACLFPEQSNMHCCQ
jgi:hypothetical protein